MRRLTDKRILIVEDEHLIAELERAALEAMGAIIVGPVDNEAAAFALISNSPPHVVALDWNLRGQHPSGLAAYLKGCSIPFVIVSGYDRETLPSDVRSALYIQKPFAQDELVQMLARAAGQAPPARTAGA